MAMKYASRHTGTKYKKTDVLIQTLCTSLRAKYKVGQNKAGYMSG